MEFKKVLVTGASGFTGSWVLKELASRNISIRAMVRDASKFKQASLSNVEVVEGDLGNHDSLASAVNGVDAVIHIAAIFRQAGLPDEAYTQVNVEGTRKLLEFACAAGVKRFIHCSTIGVHGHITNPPATEEAPFDPGDVYQRSKLAGELVAREFFESNKINGAVIRPAMIYGPGDRRTLKIFKMLSRKRFFYVGAGDQFVHFVDVRDLARAFVDLLIAQHLHNQVYIIGGSAPMPLKDFISKITEIMDVPKPWLHLPVKPLQIAGTICEAICTPLKISPPLYRRRVDFFTKNRHFDCSKAKNDFGFKPRQELIGELKDIINSYVEKGDISLSKLILSACLIDFVIPESFESCFLLAGIFF